MPATPLALMPFVFKRCAILPRRLRLFPAGLPCPGVAPLNLLAAAFVSESLCLVPPSCLVLFYRRFRSDVHALPHVQTAARARNACPARAYPHLSNVRPCVTCLASLSSASGAATTSSTAMMVGAARANCGLHYSVDVQNDQARLAGRTAVPAAAATPCRLHHASSVLGTAFCVGGCRTAPMPCCHTSAAGMCQQVLGWECDAPPSATPVLPGHASRCFAWNARWSSMKVEMKK